VPVPAEGATRDRYVPDELTVDLGDDESLIVP
jgi:hypothetical protein